MSSCIVMVVLRQSEVRFWVALRTTHTNQYAHVRVGLGTSIFALGTHDDPIFVSDYNVGTEGEGTKPKRQPFKYAERRAWQRNGGRPCSGRLKMDGASQ